MAWRESLPHGPESSSIGNPIFSVIIDNYNYAEFLEEAIESVLNQTFPTEDIEIIVVDDGSTDDSPERIKRYGDRVTCLYKENGGQASALNAGIAVAKGEIIAFLDSDDYWRPDKLERVSEEFTKSEKMDFVYHFMNVVDYKRRIIDRYIYPAPLAGVAGPEESFLQGFLKGRLPWFSPTSGMAVRADCLRKVLPIPEDFRIFADVYLHYILSLYIRDISLIASPLGYYRMHEGNLSGGNLLTAEKVDHQVRILSLLEEHLFKHSAKLGYDYNQIRSRLKSRARVYEILGNILSKEKGKALSKIISFNFFLPEDGFFRRLSRKITLLLYVILPPSFWLVLQRRYRRFLFFLRYNLRETGRVPKRFL